MPWHHHIIWWSFPLLCVGAQSGTRRVCLLICGSVFSLEVIFLARWNTHLLFITRVAISFYSMCSDYVLCHWNVCQSPHSWEWASAMRAYAAWKPLYGASNSLAINSNHKPWADFPFLIYRYEVLSNIVDLCLLWTALTAVLSTISNLIALLTHGVLIPLYNVMFCSKCGLIWEFQEWGLWIPIYKCLMLKYVHIISGDTVHSVSRNLI